MSNPQRVSGMQFSQAEQLSALEQRLNIRMVFSVCLVAFYFIAWNRGVALLHGLWAIMIISLIASLLAPWMMLRPVRLRLHLPGSFNLQNTQGVGTAGHRRLNFKKAAPGAADHTTAFFMVTQLRQQQVGVGGKRQDMAQ